MNSRIDGEVIKNIRSLYATDRDAREFLDRAASRQRDAAATSVDRIMVICDNTRAEAVGLAKRFEEIECAAFIVGRRGSPSRVEWKFSLISLGKAAVGETTELEEVDRDAEIDEVPTSSGSLQIEDDALTINQAKERLARSLGVSTANIEIIVRG